MQQESSTPTSPLLEHLRTMLATYDKALAELFKARGKCHEQFVDEQFRLRKEARLGQTREHYAALAQEAADLDGDGLPTSVAGASADSWRYDQ